MSAPVGSPDRRASVLRLAAPLVVSFAMRAAFTLVDTAYAATLGDAAVAAVGLTIPFEFLMIAVWVGLLTGLTSCLSRAMGARQGKRIQQYLRVTWNLVWWTSPAFLLVAAGIWYWAPRSGLDPSVARAFQIYGTVLIGGSAFTTFWSVIPDSVVKAHHDTKLTMWAGIWSNLINVGLNTIFTFVFHWGVFGIALSTVLGRIGGLVYALRRARSHETRRIAAHHDTVAESDPHPYAAVLALAGPSSLTFALTATESAVVNALLARGADATEAIAAFSVYSRVVLFALNPILATAVAMLPYSARMHSTRDRRGLHRGLRESLLASGAYAVFLVAPVMLLSASTVAEWIAESARTAAYAAAALRVVPLACLVSAPFLLCRPLFEGMGRGRPGLAVAFFRYAILVPALIFAGIHVAQSLRAPTLYGALGGTLAAGTLSSTWFLVWARRVLSDFDRSVQTRS